MKTEDLVTLSFYEETDSVSSRSQATLVKHIESGKLYLKKTASVYDKELYSALQIMQFPGVPKIYHVIEDDDKLIIIEEYINGETLSSHLARVGTIDEHQAIDIILKICDILEKLHKMNPPIIHRDIKPSNIMIDSDFNVTLIDFNAAKFFDKEKNRDTILMGTVDYAAPEQFGFSQSDPRTDIYSLGILLNVMLTGETPKNKKCAKPLSAVVSKCTEVDSKKRYPSVYLLKNALVHADKKSIYASAVPPGFRSRTPWKMVVAIIGYVLILDVCLTLEPRGNLSTGLLWANRLVALAWLMFTIALCGNCLNLAGRLPLTNNKNVTIRIIGFIVWSCAALFVLISILVFIEEMV